MNDIQRAQRAMWGVRIIGEPHDAVAQLLAALDAFDAADRAHWVTQPATGTAVGDEQTGRTREQALIRLHTVRSRFIQQEAHWWSR